MKIVVGLSGGVDSSVTAYLLKQAGHEVIGATMIIRGNRFPENSGKGNSCFGPDKEEDIRETGKFCRQINIPFHTFDCSNQLNEFILSDFRKEYLSGRTPNPCIRCNQLIKFGFLLEAVRNSGIEFDLFSTGHYARVEGDIKAKHLVLKKAIDLNKDQSYFLYRLNREQLSSIFFPLGYYYKEQIKEIAREKGFRAYKKEESQDFYCGDYAELLEVEEKEGNIIDKNGIVLGTHKGVWNFTRGQRRGLGVSASKPLYVIGIRPDSNEIVAGFGEETFNRGFFAGDMHWLVYPSLTPKTRVFTKVRSTQKEKEAFISFYTDDTLRVDFAQPQKAIAPGQSAVFYTDDTLLGGGIIDSVF